jgi:hypothetical protein
MAKLRQSFEFLTTHDELGNIINTRMSQMILGKFEPSKIRVTVAPNREKRSLEQNAFYWGVIIPAYCETTGYTPKEQDRVFEDLFAPRKVLKHRGREIVTTVHCKDLSPGEFAEYINRILVEAAEMNINIPPADPSKSAYRLDA